MAMDDPLEHDDEPPPGGLNLDLDCAVEAAGLPRPETFRQWAETALAAAGVTDPRLELSLRIVEAGESRHLNHQWRDRDRPTNVLSFPGDHIPGLPWRHLGDLVICAEVVEREAAKQGKPPEAHWAHMVVHGLLHLLGHDHQDEQDAEAMEALERSILARLGFPDPYLLPGEEA